jgi:hypothetical protein
VKCHEATESELVEVMHTRSDGSLAATRQSRETIPVRKQRRQALAQRKILLGDEQFVRIVVGGFVQPIARGCLQGRETPVALLFALRTPSRLNVRPRTVVILLRKLGALLLLHLSAMMH